MAKSFSDPDGRWVVEGVGKLVFGVVMKDTLFGWFPFDAGVGVSGVDQALLGDPLGVGTKAVFLVGRVGKSSLVAGFLVVVVVVVVVEEDFTSTLVVGLVVVVVVVDEVIGCIGAKGAIGAALAGGFVEG